MKKILVTTDFSANSKAALRFTIQLASQGEVALTFLHVQQVMRMTTWNEAAYLAYKKGELAKAKQKLDHWSALQNGARMKIGCQKTQYLAQLNLL